MSVKKSKYKSAYTLIELSIVILIVSFLMTGALTITIGSLNKAKKNYTQSKINQIYNAIGKFLLENKRLPCPASLELTKDNNLYGMEVGSGSGCSGSGVYQSPTSANIYYGMVPSKTLGLPSNMAEDEFGSKISYVIDERFTKSYQDVPNFANFGFGTTDPYTATINVIEKPSAISREITQDAILLIISHGLNKFGAFNANASTQNAISIDPNETDEASNSYSSAFDNNFIYYSQNSKTFDDLVLFKTRNQIVEDFNAFYLIACKDAGVKFENKNSYYGQTLYSTTPCDGSPTYQKILEKYCDRFGNWVDINKCENW